MEITLETIEELRADGLSWREIGLFLAVESEEEPYVLQERARGIWRRQHKEAKQTVIRKSMKVNKDRSNVSEISLLGDSFHALDGDALLRRHGYDPTYWRIIDSTCAKRGEVWSSRVKVVARDVPQLDGDEFAEFLSDALDRFDTPVPHMDSIRDMENLGLVALYDIHYGRRGIEGDHRTTEREVRSVITQAKERLTEKGVNKILLTIGQDFLNADNIAGSTTSGTPQDNSLSWHEMLSGGLALAVWVVDTLAEVAPVQVVYNEGNHDRVFSYAIVKALEQRYATSPNVTVDAEPDPRKYMSWGNSLIGLTHGKDENNLSTVMQIEEPLQWGASTHRYWFLGHVHHLEMTEKDGVTIVRCPSLAFSDDWTRRKGYVGSDRSTLCGIFGQNGMDDIWLLRP